QTKSWVGTGQNKPVSPGQLGQALGPNIIKTLSQMTGVSEDQLTKQLSQGIPVIINMVTPNGRRPTVAELSKMIGQSERLWPASQIRKIRHLGLDTLYRGHSFLTVSPQSSSSSRFTPGAFGFLTFHPMH